MKKRILGLFVLIFILQVYFASAEQIIKTSDGDDFYTVNKDVNFLYTIIIDNTDIGKGSEIMQVNIKIPKDFKFSPGYEKTNAPYQKFSNTSNLLSWSNLTGYLIGSGESKYFSFIAKNSLIGGYNLEITTLNQTGAYTSHLWVTIISSDSCNPDWECTGWSECILDKRIRSCVDVNLCGIEEGNPVETENCISECKPVWDCSKWEPKKCQKDESQARTCVDLNYCEIDIEKPNEKRSCKGFSVMVFTITIIIIITMILLVGILITERLIKKKNQADKITPQTQPSINIK